jgi:hypothetical protein
MMVPFGLVEQGENCGHHGDGEQECSADVDFAVHGVVPFSG